MEFLSQACLERLLLVTCEHGKMVRIPGLKSNLAAARHTCARVQQFPPTATTITSAFLVQVLDV